MKRNINTAIALAAVLMSCNNGKDSSPATVTITNTTGEKVYFQPEEQLGYTELESADTTIVIPTQRAIYYRLMDASGNFHQVFVTPGSATSIAIDGNGISVTGDNEAENRFMKENLYLCRTPDTIPTYSEMWVKYNEGEIARLDSLLDNSNLDPEFVATHKLYNRYTFLNQRIPGFEMAKTFGFTDASDSGESYYEFLKTLKFDNDRILSIPKWFNVINSAIEAKEKHGFIPVDNDRYIDIYTESIENADVKSAYVVNLLEFVLKRNYLNDFDAQIETVRKYVTATDDAARLDSLEKQYQTKKESVANLEKGSEMPEMTFKTVDGKEYSLNDFKNRVVVLDFWFTGCVPCRSEMPYLDRLAADMADQEVDFISISLDTGDELYATWEKMMKEKDPASKVLSVNLPGGFTSPVLEELKIRGVPRMFILNRDGRIEDAFAKRPSDPKLRQQIETLLTR